MLEIVAGCVWVSLGAYVYYFIFRAKEFQPLTLDDLALIWRIHKHQNGCRASQIHDLLLKKGQVVGFKCDCGHQYLQKRLITQKARVSVRSSKLLSISEDKNSPAKKNGAMRNLGLSYSNIKEV